MSEPFSLADAEATFGPENWEYMRRMVAAAPKFTPEQIVKLRALFASVRDERSADSAAEGSAREQRVAASPSPRAEAEGDAGPDAVEAAHRNFVVEAPRPPQQHEAGDQ